jgi:hypothetical protein
MYVSGAVMDGCLNISLNYSSRDYDEATIARLIENYHSQLKMLIDHCVKKAEPELTPSDLGDPTLNLAELVELRQRYGQNIQSVYPLSPMQEGMLFLSLVNQNSNAYFEQAVYEVRGDINILEYEKHFNRIVQKHDALRTAFVHEGFSRQVVLVERPTAVHYEDISALEAKARQQHIAGYQAEDRRHLFRLDRDPLMRLAIFKTGSQNYTVIAAFHHIIMDG